MWDFTIVGAGPTGIALAWYLRKSGTSVLLLDQSPTLGGVHGVPRVKGIHGTPGLYTTHGPKINGSAYLNYMALLKDMGLDYNALYVGGYNGKVGTTQQFFKHLDFREMMAFIGAEVALIAGHLTMTSPEGRESVQHFMDRHDFSLQAQTFINQICITTDGAECSRYTMFELLSLLDLALFYQVYMPKFPNDVQLLPLLKARLEDAGVRIKLTTNVFALDPVQKRLAVEYVSTKTKQKERGWVESQNIILAMAPGYIPKLYKTIPGAQHLDFWVDQAQKTRYLDYLPMTFYWKKKFVPQYSDIKDTPWRVLFLPYTDYVQMPGTVVVAAVTRQDVPDVHGLKAQNADSLALIQSTFRQMLWSVSLPPYDDAAVFPLLQKTSEGWVNPQYSYMAAPLALEKIPAQTEFPNLFVVGPHNGFTDFPFTSIESAVSNAAQFVRELGLSQVPAHQKMMTVKRSVELSLVLGVIISLFIYLN
jgi:hypothetical protein